MKTRSLFLAILAVLTLATASLLAQASELDPTTPSIPHGLLVRVDGHGNRTVFKMDTNKTVSDDASAREAATSFAKADNQLNDVRNVGELDEVTSNDAWYCWNHPYYGYPYYQGYSYFYSYYGYYYNYWPQYSYYWGGYSYYYYYY